MEQGIKYLTVSLLTLFFNSSCSYTNVDDEENQEYSIAKENGFHNGTFCADVEYYYSKTGTNSTYVLQVEVENGFLVKINWPNGGWLDDSHFSPPDIENGTAEFTSDQDVDYKIRIIGNENDCNTSLYVESETDLINKYKQQQDEEDERISTQKKEDEELEQNRMQEEEYRQKKKREEEVKEQEEKDKEQDDENR